MKSENQVCSIGETSEITGISTYYLRRHAERLGGVRQGDKGHWRFVPSVARERFFDRGGCSQDFDPKGETERFWMSCK